MSQSQHIIIVDDEAPAREMVGDYLKMHGFTVTLCDGGKSLRGAIETGAPDLVVLDLNMPEEDGLSIIRDLKSRTNVPVIMLTATASPIDRVVGLELGADDYVAKPFEVEELVARIRVLLRRSSKVSNPVISCGDLAFDTNTREFALAGKALLLTPRERRWDGLRDLGVIAGDLGLGLGRLVGTLEGASDGTVLVEETQLEGAVDRIILRVSHTGMLFSAEVAHEAAVFLSTGRFSRRDPASAI